MLTHKWLSLISAAGLALAVAAPVWAQRGDRDRDRDEERGDRGDRRERRFDPTELLKRMDANGNGQLEPDEVSGRARSFVERAATQAGLDPKQPLPIDKLSAAMQPRDDNERKEGEGENKTEATPATPAPMPTSGTPAPMSTVPATTEPAKTSAPPLVPGFGVDSKSTPPLGFGTAAPRSSDDDKRRSSAGDSRSTSSTSRERSSSDGGGDKREAAQKVRRYAEGLLKQYDENKNGVLERDEWKKMRGDPEKADKNDDKIITLDELADRLANYGSDGGREDRDRDRDRGERDRGSERSSNDRSRPRSEKDAAASDKKSYRYLTPTERLPKGLPTWFTRNDADADGQVTMAEYSTSYNETTVAEFSKYDLDRDGIITPAECLQAEQEKTAKK